jgi:hypothetical protein
MTRTTIHPMAREIVANAFAASRDELRLADNRDRYNVPRRRRTDQGRQAA